ncbi:MAG: DUF2779 domain-containing protein [Alphaproteobacteria bacterium]|jgi:CRISPR/Cas system-associated exonuclease Cas4 (RecB family)|nr:DUF2779 domain-containing protein [Alphaproteobacteria bacterium]
MRSLSKSQYCKGRRCLKRIWLYNFRKDLIQETSTFQQSVLAQGNEVGELAREHYSGGVLIDEDYKNLDKALEHTQAEIQNGAKAIFEAAFLFENVAVRVDILVRNPDGSFDLIEVKSSTEVKEKEHLPDCAIQTYVLQQSGIRLRRVCLAHLNNQYVRQGALNLSELFIVESVDDRLKEKLSQVPDYLSRINETLSQDEEPYRDIGSICKNPYDCEFKHYCWKDVPEKSIHYLSGIRDEKRGDLLSEGIELVKDIPENVVTDLQLIQVMAEKNQEEHIDLPPISEHLKQLKFPLSFLDFETIGYAIPRFDGNRPYQKLPFQYSLHIKSSPDSALEHREFLFEENENPMRVLAERLAQDLSPEGSIIVYNMSFEKGCLEELAKAFPDLAPDLNNMIDRLWDLMVPFKEKWFYDPSFNGSYSIKKVLPVLAPALSYADLGIQDGGDALAKYLSFINDKPLEAERAKIKNDLLEYCKLDSLAMVKILEELLLINNSSLLR